MGFNSGFKGLNSVKQVADQQSKIPNSKDS